MPNSREAALLIGVVRPMKAHFVYSYAFVTFDLGAIQAVRLARALGIRNVSF